MIGINGAAPIAALQRQRVLWRLVKPERTAVAVAREVGGYGIELRIDVDGELRWSAMFRHGQGLDTASAEKRRVLEERGWREE